MRLGFTVIVVTLATSLAHAAGGDHHAGLTPEVQKTIMFQILNVTLLFGGLVYFLKDGVRQFFADKRAQYLAFAERAQQSRLQAEQEHAQIKLQLTKLESTADESVQRAKAEAADLKRQLIAEAQETARRLRLEAEQAARLEVEKARHQLRKQMIGEATQAATQQISTGASANDHQRLQNDFIRNIEEVRS